MGLKLCVKCKKRAAAVFISKLENGKMIQEGYCLHCAKELKLPQIDDALSNMGIDPDELDSFEREIENLDTMDIDTNEPGESRTPSLNLGELLNQFQGIIGNLPMGNMGHQNQPKDDSQPKTYEEKKEENKKTKKRKDRKYLDAYCKDLTTAAKEGKIDQIVGRERETARLMQILCRRQKNNPCLIGEPGVGKTAIAENLALKINSGDVPFKLKDKEVFLLDLTSLVAGTQFRGQFEARMKGLIDEIKSFGNIILVIDEVHSIVGAGDSEGSMNAANILKPALSRGEIQIIGATTLTEYRKYIEKDSALERRFQPIVVEEPSIEETKIILKGIKKYYEDFHRINIPENVINLAVDLSERYITDRFLPDKAIDMIDEAAAYVAMNSPILEREARAEEEIAGLESKIEELENDIKVLQEDSKTPREENETALNQKYGELATLKSGKIRSEQEYDELKKELSTIELTPDSLARVVSIWTGIPSGSISVNEFEKLSGLENRIKSRIIGQDQAVDSVVRAIKRNRAGVSYKRKPTSFIFAGPTGVGKTELVKVLSADLFNTPESMIRLDMSEYMEKASVARIIGSPPGYVGYDDAGQLTEKVRRKPYSVILFDEIEKAHPDVLNIMLQILDDGKLTDSHGKEVKFDNCVIVMTTNAGSTKTMNTVGFNGTTKEIADNKTETALLEFLRPEFINRVDEVITFRSLDENDFMSIASIMLNDTKKAVKERGINLSWDSDVEKFVATKSFSAKYGARNMRRFISREIEDLIAEIVITKFNKKVKNINIYIEDDTIKVK